MYSKFVDAPTAAKQCNVIRIRKKMFFFFFCFIPKNGFHKQGSAYENTVFTYAACGKN